MPYPDPANENVDAATRPSPQTIGQRRWNLADNRELSVPNLLHEQAELDGIEDPKFSIPRRLRGDSSDLAHDPQLVKINKSPTIGKSRPPYRAKPHRTGASGLKTVPTQPSKPYSHLKDSQFAWIPDAKGWCLDETTRLREAVIRHGTVGHWRQIAHDVTTRDAQQCYDRWYRHPPGSLSRDLWPISKDAGLIMYLFQAKPELLDMIPAFRSIRQQLRRHQIEYELTSDQVQPSPGLLHSSSPPVSSAASPEPIKLTDPADHPEPPTGFWHRAALTLDPRSPSHPFHCRLRFLKLARGAELLSSISYESMVRLRKLHRERGAITVEEARAAGAPIETREIKNLVRAISLRWYISRRVVGAYRSKPRNTPSTVPPPPAS
ncbi:hypothetical protein IWQ60_001706 [Tieghemiomyces parasiticus]|uniref:Myb-like domain-containing protein n=1 Tax=Tieghemiomyces parasiticus TaxID=78921 RepID=A0A9W8E1M6_9FUNG|nr:hypothetical protein IWQ60_001706 [Tieghemiomyces parasiticus]